MHGKLYNQARLSFTLAPRSPVLIRSGFEGLDPVLPEVSCVRTRAAGGGRTVFFPGTTLKGLFRAHVERVLRSFGLRCCDPLGEREPCRRGDLRGFKVSGDTAFKRVCYACQMFGSPSLAGRTMVSDALPRSEEAARAANATENRTSIAVDRLLGSVAAGPFEVETICGGLFGGEVVIRNFPLWSLGVLALIIRDLDDRLLQIGFGKSRGFGFVAARVEGLSLVRYPRGGGDEVFAGLLALSGTDLRAEGERRGLTEADQVPLPAGVATDASWCRRTYRLDAAQATSFLGGCVEGPLAALAEHGAKGGRRE